MPAPYLQPTRAGATPCAVALCLPLLLTACAKPSEDIAATPLPVKTFQLGSDAVQPQDLFPVSMARDRESNVSFRVGGVIQTLTVRAGQLVQSGQALASLTATPYTANRMRAEADVNKLQNAARRNQELLGAGAVSSATREDTEDTLSAATAALQAAQYDEASTTLRAPFAGVVLSRDAEVGETVAPGQRVLRIADLGSRLIAKAAVPSQAARHLRVGGTAQVRLGERTLAATIRTIGALSDPRTGTVTVELLVPQSPAIASGTTGSVAFAYKAAGQEAQSLLLPPEALLEAKDGTGSVYVLETASSTARRASIQVLGLEGEMIRIAGLGAGVKVLTTGAGFVSDGQKVQEMRP